MIELYRRIWSTTWRSQILLILLSIGIAVLAAVPLQYQKEIINGLAGEMQFDDLLLLGTQFLGFLLLSSLLKLVLGYRSAIVSEAVIRRIRGRVLQDSVEGRRESPDGTANRGTLVTIIASEAEEVGKFVGSAIASPLMQLGILVSVIGFVAATQPMLGLIMVGIVLPQAIIVMSIQKQVNAKIAERITVLRRATNRITAKDIESVVQAVLADFDEIYEARQRIYLFKQSSKFVLNAINGAGSAGLLLLGGWLVLQGRTDIGSVVAALSGQMRISQPWRELIAFYRELSAVRVKFELLDIARPR